MPPSQTPQGLFFRYFEVYPISFELFKEGFVDGENGVILSVMVVPKLAVGMEKLSLVVNAGGIEAEHIKVKAILKHQIKLILLSIQIIKEYLSTKINRFTKTHKQNPTTA